MSAVYSGQPTILGLFEQRFAGDDCLMKLASRRFFDAGMGAEMHAGAPEHLEWVMGFRPWPESPVIVHLPRDFNLIDTSTQKRILDFASRFAGRILGLVLHDHPSMVEQNAHYLSAARTINEQFQRIDRCPMLFIEYAVGLEPADFAKFFWAIPELQRIGPCIDIGHVGIRAARAAYARSHGGEDICALKSQGPQLPRLLPDVEAAVASGRAAVFELIEVISALKKPVHFHLHDGHPLSTFSPFGVSDHLSFLTQIPLTCEYRGRRTLPPMFGPAGLAKVLAQVRELMGNQRITFTLEIHPTGERLALGDAAPLFEHWTDKTHAEQMNHWLAVLVQNHQLLR